MRPLSMLGPCRKRPAREETRSGEQPVISSFINRTDSKKNSPILWNVLEKIFDPKKNSPPDGAFLELEKKGGGRGRAL